MHSIYTKCRWMVCQTAMASSLLELRSSAWEILQSARFIYFDGWIISRLLIAINFDYFFHKLAVENSPKMFQCLLNIILLFCYKKCVAPCWSLLLWLQSCIIKRYCEKRFVSKHLATIGIDYGVTR